MYRERLQPPPNCAQKPFGEKSLLPEADFASNCITLKKKEGKKWKEERKRNRFCCLFASLFCWTVLGLIQLNCPGRFIAGSSTSLFARYAKLARYGTSRIWRGPHCPDKMQQRREDLWNALTSSLLCSVLAKWVVRKVTRIGAFRLLTRLSHCGQGDWAWNCLHESALYCFNDYMAKKTTVAIKRTNSAK